MHLWQLRRELYRAKLFVLMGFCFCLSSHIRTKHSIFFVFTNVEVIWKQNQFLKAQQAKKFWRPVQPILVAQIPPHLPLRSPAIMCTAGCAAAANHPWERTTKHPRERFWGPVTQQGQAPLAPEGFSWSTNIETVLRIQVYFLKQKSFLMDLANTLYYFIV